MGCGWGDDYLYSGGGDGGGGSSDSRPYDEHPNDPRDPSSWKWRSDGFGETGNNGGGKDNGGSGSGSGSGDMLTQPAAAVKKAAKRGVDWLSDALAKLKAAAEDTAHAASRPRHW